ncbi:MAG: YdcF family protein [Planctomycetes bacterium]|nr:YdcF family protein [Planctomycetota bacterium]
MPIRPGFSWIEAHFTTRDHPAGVRTAAGLDPEKDTVIIVTSYSHLRRARACFEHAGYKHIIMQEPRWERRCRAPEETGWKSRFLIYPQLVYEAAAWIEYKCRGVL